MLDVQQSLSRRIANSDNEEDINKTLMDRQDDSQVLFLEYELRTPDKDQLQELIRNTMIYRGDIGKNAYQNTVSSTYRIGDTYRVVGNSRHIGIDCTDGDLIIAVQNYVGKFRNQDWAVLRSMKGSRDPRTGFFNSNITETREIIMGKPGIEEYDNNHNIAISNYGKRLPVAFGNFGQLGRAMQVYQNTPSKDDPIVTALRALAAQPSTDPYKENKLKKDDSCIEAKDVDINALRASISGE